MSYQNIRIVDENRLEEALNGIQDIPSGGTSGQVLKKKSNTDYDVEWGEGGGSSSSSISITNSTNDLTGETVTIKLSGAVLTTATVGDIVPVSTLGNYTIECGVYSVNVAVIAFGASYTADLTTTNSWQMWVDASGLDHTDYANLGEVLADEKAIRRLMTIHASVDFLADDNKNATLISTIINDDYCAKWINLRDYALDTLYANSDIASIMDTADKYFYGEWALMPQVPTMTSYTAPYGEVIYNGTIYNNYYPWYCFNPSHAADSALLSSKVEGQTYIGYKFISIQKISAVSFRNNWAMGSGNADVDIIGSNDGNEWTVISTITNIGQGSEIFEKINGNYQYYAIRLKKINSSIDKYGFNYIQFYAWQPKGNVPIMTSNTAPYGKASASSEYNSDVLAWKAFNNGSLFDVWAESDGRYESWCGYTFVNPITIKAFSVESNNLNRAQRIILQGSNDSFSTTVDIKTLYVGTDYEDATTNFIVYTFSVNSSTPYSSYRLLFTDKKSGLGAGNGMNIGLIQFYGRELKVSVPKMTSNTAPYGEASASSIYNSNYPAWKAFDKNETQVQEGRWVSLDSDSNPYVQYKFNTKVRVKIWYAITLPSASTALNAKYRLDASNDGTNWTPIASMELPNQASYKKYVDVDSIIGYQYFRINVKIDGIGRSDVQETQLYGLDYSEYDWDEDNPRHYIYDHGVELESLASQINGTGIAEKQPEQLYLYKNGAGGSSDAMFYTTSKIDLTSYSLLRCTCGDRAYTNTSTQDVAQQFVRNDIVLSNTGGTASAQILYSYLPHDAVLSVESIDDLQYILFVDYTGGSYTRYATISEWWLE